MVPILEEYVEIKGLPFFSIQKRPPSYENPFNSGDNCGSISPAPDYINTMLEGHDW